MFDQYPSPVVRVVGSVSVLPFGDRGVVDFGGGVGEVGGREVAGRSALEEGVRRYKSP